MKHDVLKQSHFQSQDKSAKKEILVSQKMLSAKELQNLLNRKSLLIDVSSPFLSNLATLVEGSGFLIILTDEQGCILRLDGDSKILLDAKSLNLVPGAFMEEDSIGSSAMMMGLNEDRPVQITAQGHFINAYHRWTCSSAPIHSTTGITIGTLNLMGQKQQVNTHTLALVAATINAIEQQFRNLKLNKALRQTTAYLDAVINNLTNAILTINTSGNISKVNKSAKVVFGIEPAKLTGQPIKYYMPRWDDLWKVVSNGGNIIDEEVSIENIPYSGRFVIGAMPIVTERNIADEELEWDKPRKKSNSKTLIVKPSVSSEPEQLLLGVVLTIRDMKRVYNIVNKFTGMKAYYTFDDIIGVSDEMKRIVDFAQRVADSPSTVLVSGESGTGKEVFAQAIHNASGRRNSGFVAINCGAIPEALFESELFGYEDGAFTGARKGGKPGKFELANGGTLFLDEVGEMPMDMQVKLLRALQEGEITRVGGNKAIPVDVRVVAATNKNLKTLVEQNKFRNDLYYRLSVIPIKIPPLRDRQDDIKALIEFFLLNKSLKLNKSVPILNDDIRTILLRYEWPGNVRELENFIEKTVNLDGRIMLDVEDEVAFRNKYLHNFVAPNAQKGVTNDEGNLYNAKSLEEIEKDAIVATLKHFDGNKTKAAKILKISRNTLYLKAKHFGLALH
ncbi:MAG TPA: sigma-54-dependent Fis family transcriptional regulator [Bacteroidales bacterium]|nr:sigma-54-dependent Fis family transcriptional regulator [Bacteroidales bacterium]